MTINPDTLLAWKFPVTEHRYAEKDAILYALGVGLGADPTDERELRYVYERELAVLPTLAAVIGHPGPWYADPRTGIDWVHVLHGEQSATWHAPLAPADTLTCRTEVTDVEDKGPGRGALVRWRRSLSRGSDETPVATLESVLFCRADGGFGGAPRPKTVAAQWPDIPPALTVTRSVSARAGLIYRLSGDLNPVHVDPEVARKAGFERPILHGLCTFAVAAWALVTEAATGNAAGLRSMHARFRAPVYPGETLRTEIWPVTGGVRFRTSSVERNLLVLDSGSADIVEGAV
jgi:acyl dehydratase